MAEVWKKTNRKYIIVCKYTMYAYTSVCSIFEKNVSNVWIYKTKNLSELQYVQIAFLSKSAELRNKEYVQNVDMYGNYNLSVAKTIPINTLI